MSTTDDKPASTPTTKPRRLGKRTVSTTNGATGPTAPPAPEPKPTPAVAIPAPKKGDTGTPKVRSDQSNRARADAETPTPGEHIRYDELPRKETRLREDQVDALNTYARRLARAAQRQRRPGDPTERITDNTLIRVAVDLLLARADALEGTTEAELRDSIGLTH